MYILYIQFLTKFQTRTHFPLIQKITFESTITSILTQTNKLPTMSNLEDTDSASSASTWMDKAIVTKDELPRVTYEHLQTLTQGYVSNALTEWAMVTPQRKYNFIQAVKAVMTQNNLWTYEKDSLMEELERHPSFYEDNSDPEGPFTLNDVDPRHGPMHDSKIQS